MLLDLVILIVMEQKRGIGHLVIHNDASKFISSGYRLDLYCEGDKNINTTNISVLNNSNNKLSMIVFNKYGIYYWNSTTQIWAINP